MGTAAKEKVRRNLRRISLDVEVGEAKETRIIRIQQEGGPGGRRQGERAHVSALAPVRPHATCERANCATMAAAMMAALCGSGARTTCSTMFNLLLF